MKKHEGGFFILSFFPCNFILLHQMSESTMSIVLIEKKKICHYFGKYSSKKIRIWAYLTH